MDHAKHRHRPIHYNTFFHVTVLVFLVVTMVMCYNVFTLAAEQIGVIAKVALPAPATAATTVQHATQTTADLVITTEHQLFVFSWDEQQSRYRERFNFGQFPAPISAVAARPGTDGETILIWIGMQGSGSVQLYALQGHQLSLVSTVGRLWSNVQQLIVFDADEDGCIDVAARSSAGVAALFRFDGQRYNEVWRTAPDDEPDAWLAVGHVIDSQFPTIVIGKNDGQFSLYGWEPSTTAAQMPGMLRKRYDNFPWGRVQALHTWPQLSTADHVRDDDMPLRVSDDVYVISSQGWVYQYTWSLDESRLVQQWPHTLGETVSHLQLTRGGDAEYPGWVGIQAGALRAYHLNDNGLHEVWHIPGMYTWVQTAPAGVVLAAYEEKHDAAKTSVQGLLVIGPVADNFVRVERRGRPVTLNAKPLIEEGQVFLSLDDMAALLSMRAWTANGGTRVFGLAPLFQFYVVDVGSNTALVNGTTKHLTAPVRIVNGDVYLPAAFAAALGVPYEWDDLTRTLVFE